MLIPALSPDISKLTARDDVETALELEEGVVMGDLDFFDGHLAVWLRWLGNPGIAVAPIDGGQAHALPRSNLKTGPERVLPLTRHSDAHPMCPVALHTYWSMAFATWLNQRIISCTCGKPSL